MRFLVKNQNGLGSLHDARGGKLEQSWKAESVIWCRLRVILEA